MMRPLPSDPMAELAAAVQGPDHYLLVVVRGRRLRARCLPGILLRRARVEMELHDPISFPFLLATCLFSAWPSTFQQAMSLIHPWFWPGRWIQTLPRRDQLDALTQLLDGSERITGQGGGDA